MICYSVFESLLTTNIHKQAPKSVNPTCTIAIAKTESFNDIQAQKILRDINGLAALHSNSAKIKIVSSQIKFCGELAVNCLMYQSFLPPKISAKQ